MKTTATQTRMGGRPIKLIDEMVLLKNGVPQLDEAIENDMT